MTKTPSLSRLRSRRLSPKTARSKVRRQILRNQKNPCKRYPGRDRDNSKKAEQNLEGQGDVNAKENYLSGAEEYDAVASKPIAVYKGEGTEGLAFSTQDWESRTHLVQGRVLQEIRTDQD